MTAFPGHAGRIWPLLGWRLSLAGRIWPLLGWRHAGRIWPLLGWRLVARNGDTVVQP